MTLSIGTCFHREHDPARVVEQVRAAENAGYDEFWVIEDCFFTAGVSLAGASLAVTNSIAVGIGIMPSVARNPAVTAMEIATLAGLGPGRFHAGIGHGVQSWMAQMDEQRDSPLTMLGETLSAVRALLQGRTVTTGGRYVKLDQVTLELPPDPVPNVSAGVRGPRSLEISGRSADGTILADFVNPTYLRWAREQIDCGRNTDRQPAAVDEMAGAPPPHHRVTVFATSAIGDDGDEMRRRVTPLLSEICADAPLSLRMAPFFDELSQRAARSSWEDAIAAMPADWWRDIAAVGTPDDAAEYVARLEAAGADALALFPSFEDPVTDLRQTAEFLL
jgi:alkanesulfonate monooxygenase SsuD/methylene tetrahydromethanopterin reductase-like flavin-dependent oxidoreductase (luciferase family)